MDADDFKSIFFEEARELLISLEEGLIDLERRQGDRAHLDRTFRAAHSIKGAAAMVGLASLAEFTHGIETVLDKIRAETLKVDSDIITTLLERATTLPRWWSRKPPTPPSRCLRTWLSGLRPWSAIRISRAPRAPPLGRLPLRPRPHRRRRRMSCLSPRLHPPRHPPESGPGKPKKAAAAPKTTVSTRPAYRINLKPGPDMLRRGVNPLGVLDELRELGETRLQTDPTVVPPLDEIDAERCYLSWEIEVETDAAPERLDDVFLFVAEDSAITIERLGSDGEFELLRAPAAGCLRAGSRSHGGSRGQPPPFLRPSQRNPSPRHRSTARPRLPSSPPPRQAPRPPRPRCRTFLDLPRGSASMPNSSTTWSAWRESSLSSRTTSRGFASSPGAQHWVNTLEALERVSRQIRDTTLDLRMVPVDVLFSRFRRVVRDLSDRTRKEIELKIIGEETRLDRTIIEPLGRP